MRCVCAYFPRHNTQQPRLARSLARSCPHTSYLHSTQPPPSPLPPRIPSHSRSIRSIYYVPPRALWGWYGGMTPGPPPPPPPLLLVLLVVVVVGGGGGVARVGGSATPAAVTMKKARLLPTTWALAGGAGGRASLCVCVCVDVDVLCAYGKRVPRASVQQQYTAECMFPVHARMYPPTWCAALYRAASQSSGCSSPPPPASWPPRRQVEEEEEEEGGKRRRRRRREGKVDQ